MRQALLLLLGPGLAACSAAAPPPPPPGACAAEDALFAASDYASSAVGAITADGGGTLATGVDLGKDPALTVTRGRPFFIARDTDLLFELDPRCGTPLHKTSVHTGTGTGTTNPQDVAVAADGSLWIARFNLPSLLVLEADASPRTTVDLSSFDGDGNPNVSSIRIVPVGGRDKAFVTLERLDDTDPLLHSKQPSFLLRVDVATATVEATTVLAGRNPFGLMVESEGALFLAEPGNFDDASEPLAGVERFDTQTGTTRLLASETDLGGSVAEVAVTTGCGAAIVADATGKNRTSLVTFDPDGGALTTAASPIYGPTSDYYLQGLSWHGDVLFVGDRAPRGGGFAVHVFDRVGACGLALRPDAVFLGQAPVAIRTIP